MAQLRAVWQDVQRASQVGHTLRVIHRRLNQMGIPITYRRLTVYRGRLQKRVDWKYPSGPPDERKLI